MEIAMLKCAFYEREITPPLGCAIPGYSNLRPGSDVKDRLMVKACVVSDGKETVALIALDALRILNRVRNAIAARVSKFTGIPESNVLVAAIHTHTGIPDANLSKNPEAAENQGEYFDFFQKVVADCAILAYNRLEDSELSFGIGNVEGISFCRDYIMKNSTPRTNPGRLNPDIVGPAAPIDTELPVLFVKDAQGNPKGAVICFACHLDCVDGTEYSGDFASELSNQLKKLYGNDFVSVFFMGTSGDINHFNVNTAGDAPDHYRKMGKKIAGEALRVISFADPVEGDSVKCKYEILKINRAYISEEAIANAKHIVETVKEAKGVKVAADNTDPDQYNLMMAKKLLNFLNDPEVFDVPVHFVQIGNVKIYGFPSEIFCHFGLSVKERCNCDTRMVLSYCNGAYGYVPTRDMFYETVYESSSCRLDHEAGYIMADKLVEMGK